jgi:hypothetical protein
LRYYHSSPHQKWKFFLALSNWRLLLVLAERVAALDYPEQHIIACADVFVELIDRLSADENGQLLLQPIAHCPELLDGLITTALAHKCDRRLGQRTAAMRCVLRIVQRCTLEKVQGPPTSPYQSFGSTIVNLVPNQLAPLREPIFEVMETQMTKFTTFILEQQRQHMRVDNELRLGKPLPESAVRHTAYVVKIPFTECRLAVVDALVEIVAHNPSMMSYFDIEIWRTLVKWFFEYAHNNLYHAAFYQLVFIALRTPENQDSLRILVKNLKLVTLLIEHYRDDGPSASNKGYALQCCNAIRLQAASQSPDAFLRNFLQSHTTWRGFNEELRAQTNLICINGLGFDVPQPSMRPNGYAPKEAWPMLNETDEENNGIDLGSEFARSLGFVDDVAWPEEQTSDITKKKMKHKNKGKKKGNQVTTETGSSANNDDRDDDAGDNEDEEAPDVAEETSVKTTKKKNKKKNKKK